MLSPPISPRPGSASPRVRHHRVSTRPQSGGPDPRAKWRWNPIASCGHQDAKKREDYLLQQRKLKEHNLAMAQMMRQPFLPPLVEPPQAYSGLTAALEAEIARLTEKNQRLEEEHEQLAAQHERLAAQHQTEKSQHQAEMQCLAADLLALEDQAAAAAISAAPAEVDVNGAAGAVGHLELSPEPQGQPEPPEPSVLVKSSGGDATAAPSCATEDSRGRPLAPAERLRHLLSSPPAADSAAAALEVAEMKQHGRALAPVERRRHARAGACADDASLERRDGERGTKVVVSLAVG